MLITFKFICNWCLLLCDFPKEEILDTHLKIVRKIQVRKGVPRQAQWSVVSKHVD